MTTRIYAAPAVKGLMVESEQSDYVSFFVMVFDNQLDILNIGLFYLTRRNLDTNTVSSFFIDKKYFTGFSLIHRW